MILVDIEVPILGKTYDFQMDENYMVADVIQEVKEVLCMREQCMPGGDLENLSMWNRKTSRRISLDQTLKESQIITGSSLLLV